MNLFANLLCCRLPYSILWLVLLILPLRVMAEETFCAKVSIEIKQELTLERQAFDATCGSITALKAFRWKTYGRM